MKILKKKKRDYADWNLYCCWTRFPEDEEQQLDSYEIRCMNKSEAGEENDS